MKRKVVRIGGTAYSGSTLLGFMLANDPNGFFCGEIHSLLHPYRLNHFYPKCSCHDSSCAIWKKVKAGGKLRVWQTLTELFPETKYFVDSSKHLLWHFDRLQKDECKGFELKNVLIWKTPAEFAYSCFKRDKLRNWKRAYLNYYRRYFEITRQWHSVRYSDLVRNPAKKTSKTL